jgi:hypothetical protein
MTNPDNLIVKLQTKFNNADRNGNIVVTEQFLSETLEMIVILKRERDEAEVSHFELGYN